MNTNFVFEINNRMSAYEIKRNKDLDKTWVTFNIVSSDHDLMMMNISTH